MNFLEKKNTSHCVCCSVTVLVLLPRLVSPLPGNPPSSVVKFGWSFSCMHTCAAAAQSMSPQWCREHGSGVESLCKLRITAFEHVLCNTLVTIGLGGRTFRRDLPLHHKMVTPFARVVVNTITWCIVQAFKIGNRHYKFLSIRTFLLLLTS